MPLRSLKRLAAGTCLLLAGCNPASSVEVHPSSEPTPARATRLEALYQPFEQGFMVQPGDRECIYVYSTSTDNIIIPSEFENPYHYCLEFGGLPAEIALTTAPDGLLLPEGGFGRVWSYYEIVRDSLGSATAPPEPVAGVMQPSEPAVNGGVYWAVAAPLPDHGMLRCGMRAATAGTCTIR